MQKKSKEFFSILFTQILNRLYLVKEIAFSKMIYLHFLMWVFLNIYAGMNFFVMSVDIINYCWKHKSHLWVFFSFFPQPLKENWKTVEKTRKIDCLALDATLFLDASLGKTSYSTSFERSY